MTPAEAELALARIEEEERRARAWEEENEGEFDRLPYQMRLALQQLRDVAAAAKELKPLLEGYQESLQQCISNIQEYLDTHKANPTTPC